MENGNFVGVYSYRYLCQPYNVMSKGDILITTRVQIVEAFVNSYFSLEYSLFSYISHENYGSGIILRFFQTILHSFAPLCFIFSYSFSFFFSFSVRFFSYSP